MGDLKAPFPYFGGKRRVASLVWSRLGDVSNFIEPFCGSAAVLLARPTPPKIETINDLDCYVSNAWRAISRDPEGVAAHADHPVSEADLHSKHRRLMGAFPQPAVVPPEFAGDEALAAAYLRGWRDSYGEFDAASFRRRMRTDPDYYSVEVAGAWIYGLCCWIGSGWCQTPSTAEEEKRPRAARQNGSQSSGDYVGVLRNIPPDKRPILAGAANEHGERTHQGQGVHAKGDGLSEKMPRMNGARKGDEYYGGLGVHLDKIPDQAEPHAKRPQLHTGNSEHGRGVHGKTKPSAEWEQIPELGRGGSRGGVHREDGHRPQLADAYARGRGVHGNDAMGTCDQRRAWLVDWFGRLRDRLRTVRVCCGDWRRVCDSPSVTTRLGMTGVFFDPPYSTEAGRCNTLYGHESGTVAHDVRAYCLERGADPLMRICLAGYSGEGHEELEGAGWEVVAWKAAGGYGNRSVQGKENAAKERLWFSPHCLKRADDFLPLFDALPA